MKRKWDALIESYEDWLSWKRARSDYFDGEYEVIDELARLRELQRQEAA